MSEAASSASPAPANRDKYVVVARRYRPLDFDQLVGQGHVGQALKNAIETQRVGHAYLFTGARGVGKTSTARIFAKALNAPEGPTAHPDNQSDICQAIDAGEDVDVLEIDGASNRGIDEIRSLRAGVGVRPSRARYKIYIIDEVHMLTQAAFNALLKTLEEPPEHVKFIFCTTDPEKIPITVLSRCQRFDFAPVETDEIVQRLREIITAEEAEADEEALRLLARRAAGSMRDSQSLLEQVLSFSSGRLTIDSVHRLLGTADDARLDALTSALIDRDGKEALEQADAAIAAGVDAGQLAEQLLGYFRDLLTATVGCTPEMLRHSSESIHGELRQRGEQWGLATILAIVGLLDQTLVRIRQSVHGRVLLEAALVQVCQLPDLQRIADAVAGLPAPSRAAASGEKKKRDNGGLSPPPPFSPSSAASPSPPQPSGAPAAPAESGSAPAPSGSAPSPAPAEPPAAGPRLEASRSASPGLPERSGPVAASPAASEATAAGAPAKQREAFSPGEKSAPAGELPAGADAAGGGADGSEEAAAPAAGEPIEWTVAGAQRLWEAAARQLDDMTADLARQASRVEPLGEGKLRIFFPKDRGLTKTSCEKPDRKSKLEGALKTVAARHVHIEFAFDAHASQPSAAVPAPSLSERKQQQRALKTHPFVQQCASLFGAEVVKVDEPRPRRSS